MSLLAETGDEGPDPVDTLLHADRRRRTTHVRPHPPRMDDDGSGAEAPPFGRAAAELVVEGSLRVAVVAKTAGATTSGTELGCHDRNHTALPDGRCPEQRVDGPYRRLRVHRHDLGARISAVDACVVDDDLELGSRECGGK